MREAIRPEPEGGGRLADLQVHCGHSRGGSGTAKVANGPTWADSQRRDYVDGTDGQSKSCEV
eukprot:8606260-Pyramimonas_sp.AAC.1